ncbi:MAG: hypothetical protein AABX65_01380 [Nanoarchaeota archaeon]
MGNKEDKRFLVFVLGIAAIALFQSIFLFFLVNDGLTGKAVDTAAVNITINQKVSANFSAASINWGAGAVASNSTLALLDTSGPNVSNGNWSTIGVANLHLINNGNVNVSLSVKTDYTNESFFGGTGPVFRLKVLANESNSCLNATGTGNSSNLYAYVDANATGDGTLYCNIMPFEDNKDSVSIAILLGIPADASAAGQKNSSITATVSAI